MVTRIVLAALVVVAAMAVVKDGRVLHVAGLTGSCSVVQSTPGGAQLEACRAGRLEGMPDLTRQGCTDMGTVTGRRYWRCPAPLAAAEASN
jgi:hypothetical protein